ncbi:hypothetical protein [Clostridium culturomicium]|uniref:hypothetical protein n=1 Tax=Clostridium culturomicium TaxID=1499683 RepID=UPI000694206C|nr:hypothetical protein [Clostridium culturomicium]
MRSAFKKENIKAWECRINKIFPCGRPITCEWTELEDIINVLSVVSDESLGHMLCPNGGGVDLTQTKGADEEGCIEVYSGRSCKILKPKKLIFHSCQNEYEWDYFRIETEQLSPSGVYEDLGGFDCEELAYINHKYYIDRSFWNLGYYYDEYGNEKKFTDDDTIVTRVFKGDFVIFAKTSFYNSLGETYDGRHSKLNDKRFYDYVKAMCNKVTNR